MRILAGSVVNQDPEVFKAHLQTLAWQTGKFSVQLHFILDVAMDEARISALRNLIIDAGSTLEYSDPKPDGARYDVNSRTHDWSVPTFHWLGREKQKLLDVAKKEHYDAVFLADSDLLCSPDTLNSLVQCRKPVTSAVFWTRWQQDAPALPQCWMSHPYEFAGRGMEAHEFLGALGNRGLVRVGGLGACTLIRADVLDRVAYWPLVEGLPEHGMWQGEDRHFCVRAERNHVEMWADAWADVWHCYRPEDRRQIADRLLNAANIYRISPPIPGDLVSFTLEPLEEPRIAGHTEHVRGRFGAIRVLPDIERELSTMKAGDERIVRARFPLWSEVASYRGQSRLIRVRLLHVKPYAEAPTLADENVAAANIGESFMRVAA